RNRNDSSLREFFGFLWFACKQEAPYFREICRTLRIVTIAFLARPNRILIELNALGSDSTEDHRAQPSVADRQSLVPRCCRLSIPKHVGVRWDFVLDWKAFGGHKKAQNPQKPFVILVPFCDCSHRVSSPRRCAQSRRIWLSQAGRSGFSGCVRGDGMRRV